MPQHGSNITILNVSEVTTFSGFMTTGVVGVNFESHRIVNLMIIVLLLLEYRSRNEN